MMKWGMWGAHAGVTTIVLGGIGGGMVWTGWRLWMAWAVLFGMVASWEYAGVVSWEYWTRVEAREREHLPK